MSTTINTTDVTGGAPPPKVTANPSLTASLALGRRSMVEAWRTPEALFPTLLIPLFFLVVNTGQFAKAFPSSTPWLFGQSYAAFQVPASLLLAASFGGAAMFLVEDVEGGYFDKLRATPVARSALVSGRLYAEFVKTFVLGAAMMAVSFFFDVHVESGVLGFLLLCAMAGVWAMVFSGFIQLIALATRSAAATQSASMIFFPLMFLTPNGVPRDELSQPMEIAATINPMTYVMEGMRSLVLEGFDAGMLAKAFIVIAAAGALMVALSVRAINTYD